MNVFGVGAWKFKAFEDAPAAYTNKPPNLFWRWMQYLCFGFRWEKL